MIVIYKSKFFKKRYKAKCKNCGKTFIGFRKKQMYCIRNCATKIWAKKNPLKIKLWSKRYRLENKEKILNSAKKYRKENREKILKNYKKWREKNIEHHRNYARIYYHKNQEKIRQYARNFYYKNREKLNQQNKEYYHNPKNNPKIKKRKAIWYQKRGKFLERKRRRKVDR